MSERKRRKMGDIEQEIALCRANLSLSEGKIIGSMVRGDPRLSTPTTTSQDVPQSNDQNLTKLKDTLDEKNALLQAESERNVALLENQIARLQTELKRVAEAGQQREKSTQARAEEANAIEERARTFEKELKKQAQNEKEELAHLRKENTELKLQNRTLKADNKVIMNHLDRLTREIKEGAAYTSKNSLQEREFRVMKSLYQETLPNVQLRESQRHIELLEEPRHRMAAQEALERNEELKNVVRRLQEEIDFLQREKELLLEQNRQKHINLESQKQLVQLAAQEKAHQDILIRKMGDKIMSLEQANQTLRDAASQQNPQSSEQSYYRTTRVKAGQFYYRK